MYLVGTITNIRRLVKKIKLNKIVCPPYLCGQARKSMNIVLSQVHFCQRSHQTTCSIVQPASTASNTATKDVLRASSSSSSSLELEADHSLLGDLAAKIYRQQQIFNQGVRAVPTSSTLCTTC